jgi:hypothetical protein
MMKLLLASGLGMGERSGQYAVLPWAFKGPVALELADDACWCSATFSIFAHGFGFGCKFSAAHIAKLKCRDILES